MITWAFNPLSQLDLAFDPRDGFISYLHIRIGEG